MKADPKPSPPGFTLVEIVVVFSLIGVITIFIFSRYSNIDATTLPIHAERLAAHMRYTQARAMSTNTTWGIHYDAGAEHYWLYRDSKENLIVLPGENSEWVELDDVDIAVSEGSFTLSFDSWGRPNCEGCTYNSDRTFSLTLSKPGSSSGTISIAQNTGFIQWHTNDIQ